MTMSDNRDILDKQRRLRKAAHFRQGGHVGNFQRDMNVRLPDAGNAPNHNAVE